MDRLHKKIVFLIPLAWIFIASNAQYIGWNIPKISRNIRWECSCDFEILAQEQNKYAVQFRDELGVTKMVFYLEEDLCYGYSVFCENNFNSNLLAFIEKNYEYNVEEDYYENKKSYLFYQADNKKKIIHVIDKEASFKQAQPF